MAMAASHLPRAEFPEQQKCKNQLHALANHARAQAEAIAERRARGMCNRAQVKIHMVGVPIFFFYTQHREPSREIK